jgi:hypothetical protein
MTSCAMRHMARRTSSASSTRGPATKTPRTGASTYVAPPNGPPHRYVDLAVDCGPASRSGQQRSSGDDVPHPFPAGAVSARARRVGAPGPHRRCRPAQSTNPAARRPAATRSAVGAGPPGRDRAAGRQGPPASSRVASDARSASVLGRGPPVISPAGDPVLRADLAEHRIAAAERADHQVEGTAFAPAGLARYGSSAGRRGETPRARPRRCQHGAPRRHQAAMSRRRATAGGGYRRPGRRAAVAPSGAASAERLGAPFCRHRRRLPDDLSCAGHDESAPAVRWARLGGHGRGDGPVSRRLNWRPAPPFADDQRPRSGTSTACRPPCAAPPGRRPPGAQRPAGAASRFSTASMRSACVDARGQLDGEGVGRRAGRPARRPPACFSTRPVQQLEGPPRPTAGSRPLARGRPGRGRPGPEGHARVRYWRCG